MNRLADVVVVAWIGLAGVLKVDGADNRADPNDYGVDVSSPIHHTIKGSHFADRYAKSMKGCYDKFSRPDCDASERARMAMNLRQPAAEHNYTEIGFKKTRVPPDVWTIISQFYEDNKQKEHVEEWPPGNTYTNNWESPTFMISFEDNKLRGGGWETKQKIWDGIRPVIEEWTGKKLKESSLYGIRVYKHGAILSTHVDRLPLVSSCIIQVAQDINEPWPAEVYSHDGKAHNVSMLPGDMVLYESHTVLHGRPFPLNGKYYANIFVHFIPIDHDETNEKDRIEAVKNKPKTLSSVVSDSLKGALSGFSSSGGLKKKIGGHEQSNHDEEEVARHREDIRRHLKKLAEEGAEADSEDGHGGPAVEEEHEQEGSEGEDEEGSEGENEDAHGRPTIDGRTGLHIAASRGDVHAAKLLLKLHGEAMLHKKDANDWQPIHEAARSGSLNTLKLLIEKGADLSAQTKGGGSPLWWARRTLGDDHEIVLYLESIDAPESEEL